MANTLKFGNGQWYGKAGSILAYNDENNNYKPLPFTFTRASSATRVNESGLIESVGSGIPRVDYLNNADGHLLLEPSRTNYATYSENFSSWAPVFTAVNLNEVSSPNGSVNAAKLTDTSTSGTHRVQLATTTPSSGGFSYSIFLKKGTLSTVALSVYSGADAADSKFDLNNGTIVSNTNGTAKIEDWSNGWYRCIVSGTLASTSTTIYIYLKEKASYSGSDEYLYAWGAQLEAGSYATSYIPTSGSSVTRVIDAASQIVPSGVINQEQGTLYVEFNVSTGSGIGGIVEIINPSSTNNRVLLWDSSSGDLINLSAFFGVKGNITKNNISLGTHKAALAYSSTAIKFFLDGVKIGEVASTASYTGISKIDLENASGTVNFQQKRIKEVKLYNAALSESELIALTS